MYAKAVRLTDKVKQGLIAFITANDLQAGDKLPTAAQLCVQFGVSRTVVREAVASLQAEGRLTSMRGSGVYVGDGVPSAPGSLVMGSPDDISDILEFMEFRMSVEIEAAGLAAERRNETNILRIEQAMTSFGRAMQEGTLASDADRSLHSAIAEATGNPRFRHFVDEVGERLIPRRALGAAFADVDEQAAFLRTINDEHRAIVDAIVGRRPDAARAGMRKHLENGRRRYRNWSLEHGPIQPRKPGSV